jgi:hypothetical protein
MLSDAQLDRFMENGFVRIDHAFPREIAAEGRAALWQAIGCEPDKPDGWTRPVIRVGPVNDRDGTQPISFRDAVNTPALHEAFDRLVGRGRWKPRPNVGNFVVRFPSLKDPGDLGWHVDLSFPGETGDPTGHDYSGWRVNITSRDRALLMLFLFSDVGEDDAPTRIRIGSHFDMARLLAPAGEAGMAYLQLAEVGAQREVGGGHGVFVPSLSHPRRSEAQWNDAALRVPAAARLERALLPGAWRWRILPCRRSHEASTTSSELTLF